MKNEAEIQAQINATKRTVEDMAVGGKRTSASGSFGIGLMLGLKWILEGKPGEDVADFSLRVGIPWIDDKIAEAEQRGKAGGN